MLLTDASSDQMLQQDPTFSLSGFLLFHLSQTFFFISTKRWERPQTILYLPSLVPFTKASAEALVHHAQEYFPTPLLVMCGPEGLTGTFQVGDVCAGREGRRKTKISTHLPICQMQTHTMSSRYVYFYHRRCSIT